MSRFKFLQVIKNFGVFIILPKHKFYFPVIKPKVALKISILLVSYFILHFSIKTSKIILKVGTFDELTKKTVL